MAAGQQDSRPSPAQGTSACVLGQENVAPGDTALQQRQRMQSLRQPPAGHLDAFGPQTAPQTPAARSRTLARPAEPVQHARAAQPQLQQRPEQRLGAVEGAPPVEDGTDLPCGHAGRRVPGPSLDSLYAGETLNENGNEWFPLAFCVRFELPRS